MFGLFVPQLGGPEPSKIELSPGRELNFVFFMFPFPCPLGCNIEPNMAPTVFEDTREEVASLLGVDRLLPFVVVGVCVLEVVDAGDDGLLARAGAARVDVQAAVGPLQSEHGQRVPAEPVLTA